MVGGEPLTVEEACLRVSQLKSVICRNEAAAKYIIFVNGYVNAIGPEKQGEDFFSHYHPTRNHTGYSSVHIWFLSKNEEVEATIFGLKDFLDLNIVAIMKLKERH